MNEAKSIALTGLKSSVRGQKLHKGICRGLGASEVGKRPYLIISGMALQSTTRSPSTPLTLKSVSRHVSGSSGAPMATVLLGCHILIVLAATYFCESIALVPDRIEEGGFF